MMLLSTVFVNRAWGAVIDFDTFSGPPLFATAGNAQTLNIPTGIGTVTFQGGVILTNGTNLAADQTSIYGTAGNAQNIGVSTGTGFTNPLTVTFPVPITNFFLDLLNGNTIDVTYTVADNAGHSASFVLPPNTSGEKNLRVFPATSNVVTIAATTGQSTSTGQTWDFFIDNVHFDEPLPPGIPNVPEPAILPILGIGLTCVALRWRARRAGRR